LKKVKQYYLSGVIIERLLPHPAFGHLLPKGEGDMDVIKKQKTPRGAFW